MNLPDLNQLELIIKLCRKQGVKSIKIDNVELTLADERPISKRSKKAQHNEVQGDVVSEELSEQDLLLWSANGGIPFNNEGSGSWKLRR